MRSAGSDSPAQIRREALSCQHTCEGAHIAAATMARIVVQAEAKGYRDFEPRGIADCAAR